MGDADLKYTYSVFDGVWSGELFIPNEYLPLREAGAIFTYNCYHIHGEGSARTYMAAHPVPGPHPDYHRLKHFARLELGGLGAPGLAAVE